VKLSLNLHYTLEKSIIDADPSIQCEFGLCLLQYFQMAKQ